MFVFVQPTNPDISYVCNTDFGVLSLPIKIVECPPFTSFFLAHIDSSYNTPAQSQIGRTFSLDATLPSRPTVRRMDLSPDSCEKTPAFS